MDKRDFFKEEYLPVKVFVEEAGISASTAYGLLKSGALRCKKRRVGKGYRHLIPRSELVRLGYVSFERNGNVFRRKV